MATRDDLPQNAAADELRQAAREALVEYLRDKTTREERKAILKEAINEWMTSKFSGLGWISFQALLAAMFGMAIYLWFTYSPSGK